MGTFLQEIDTMKAFIVFALMLALTEALPNAHHNARHIDEEYDDDPLETDPRNKVAIKKADISIDEVPETEGQEPEAQIRHHIYMPLPLAYKESQVAPSIRYVPVYAQRHPTQNVPVFAQPHHTTLQNPDPRLVNFNVGGGASLGNFASGSFQTGLNDEDDGLFGTGFTFGGGLGFGPNYANLHDSNRVTYFKPGATTSGYTYIPATAGSRSATPVYRAPLAPLVPTTTQNVPLVPTTARNVPLYPTYVPNIGNKKFSRTVMYPYYGYPY